MPGDAEFTLRDATAEDAARLSVFARRVFVETFGAQNNPDDLALYLAGAFSPAVQGAELADASRRYVLVEHAGALIAYALLHDGEAHALVPAAHPVELQRFYVDHAWHGRGVAAMLMARVVELARAWGGDVLWLGVWEENPRGIRFYTKQGFTDVGSHVFVVGTDPQTDRVMMRSVSESP